MPPDTADGCFRNFAYDWAFARPVRKVFYNLTIPGLSVFVAFFIGTIEILGLIGQEYNLSGGFWSFMGNFDINKAGFVIVGIFVLTWAVGPVRLAFRQNRATMGRGGRQSQRPGLAAWLKQCLPRRRWARISSLARKDRRAP